jgi:hypothetical protein
MVRQTLFLASWRVSGTGVTTLGYIIIVVVVSWSIGIAITKYYTNLMAYKF